jgi:hypothetical protein
VDPEDLVAAAWTLAADFAWTPREDRRQMVDDDRRDWPRSFFNRLLSV